MLRISKAIENVNALYDDVIIVLTGNNAHLFTEYCEKHGLDCLSNIQCAVDEFERYATQIGAAKYNFIVSLSSINKIDLCEKEDVKDMCCNDVVFWFDNEFRKLREHEYVYNTYTKTHYIQTKYEQLCDFGICALDKDCHNIASIFFTRVKSANGMHTIYVNTYYNDRL